MSEEKLQFLAVLTVELGRMRMVLKFAPAELSEEALEVWASTLWMGHMRQEEIGPVCREWLGTEREFPVPSELLETMMELRGHR